MCFECDDSYECEEYEPDNESELIKDVTLDDYTRRFIKSLLDGENRAVEHVLLYYAPVFVDTPAPVAKPTYVVHTLWTCQEVGGFFHYTIKHGLDSTILDVSLDTQDQFNWKIVDENTISIMASEKLWGADVTVKRTGL